MAFCLCAAIELFQATGVPAELAQQWPLVRLVLGTTFVPVDLLAYAAGVVLAALADAVLSRTRPAGQPPRS